MQKVKRKQIDFGGTNVDYVKGDGSLDPKGEVIYCTFTENSEAEDGSGTIDMTAKEIYECIEAEKTVICRYSVDPTSSTYVKYINLSVTFTNKQLDARRERYSVTFERIYNNKSYKITVVYTVSTNDNVASITIENEPPKTINHEVLNVNSDSNVHDGFYFPNAVSDYDGNWYGAVIIGDQVWLAENLKSLHYSDGTEIQVGKANRDWGDVAYYPNNDQNAVEKYGMVYNWYAATRGVSTSDSETPVVGISPGTQENNDNIWHIPSRAELNTLCTYLARQTRYQNNRAKAITVSDNPYDDIDVNKTGLNIPLSGWVDHNNAATFGVSAYIYSSTRRITGTTMNTSQSYFLAIHPSQSTISVISSMFDYTKFSVRCVSDLNPIQFRNWYIQQYGSLQHHLNEAASEPVNVNLSTLTIKKNNETIDTYDPTSETDKTINIEVPSQQTIPTIRTINKEQLTDSALGDANIHDGYYFPNAVQDYDGNWYGAVVIGDQVWLAENLRTTHEPDGTSITEAKLSIQLPSAAEYYHAVDDSNNDRDYGLLYSIQAVMNGEEFDDATPSSVQGIAPTNWHIPSVGEIRQLVNYLGAQHRFNIVPSDSNLQVAKSIASVYGWTEAQAWYTPGNQPELNNATGLNIPPAGVGGTTTNVEHYGFSYLACVLTSSTPQSGFEAAALVFSNAQSYIPVTGDNQFRNSGVGSVRCVSNLTPIQFRNWYVSEYGTMQHHLSVTEEDLYENEVILQGNTCNKSSLDFYNLYLKGIKPVFYVKTVSKSTIIMVSCTSKVIWNYYEDDVFIFTCYVYQYSSLTDFTTWTVSFSGIPSSDTQVTVKQEEVDLGTLPEVTTADNGKILQVVNGVWTLVDPNNKEDI